VDESACAKLHPYVTTLARKMQDGSHALDNSKVGSRGH